jgi:diguanylate cyclase (GGDEF)-like protein
VETSDGISAWELLQKKDSIEMAILDLEMPGINGIEICRKLRELQRSTPIYIILLTAQSGKENVIKGLEAGADDYITKPFDHAELRARVESGSRIIGLQKSLAQRVEELELTLAELKKAQESLQNLSLTDELTGLYNRRGFFTLAEQHIKTALRTGNEISLIYTDMDGLKNINDTFGHEEGSEAIKQTAKILQETFRASDIIARIGGDEFVILESHSSFGGFGQGFARLEENIAQFNKSSDFPFKLSLSSGVTQITVEEDFSLQKFLTKADIMMYEKKREKSNSPNFPANV